MQEIFKFNHNCAWEQDQIKITYAELQSHVENYVQKWKSTSSTDQIQILDSTKPLDCAVGFLAAWLHGWCVAVIPATWPAELKIMSQELLAKYKNENYFYLLPTSGSSGLPKWVPITQENWSSFFTHASKFYQWKTETRVALTFEPAFDPFIAMVFMTWIQGATIIPLLEKAKFSIFDFCYEKKIQIWASVPSLVEINWSKKTLALLPELQLSLFTGETLSPELVRKWTQLAPRSQIENLYGPVETTVWVTRHILNLKEISDSIPIGQVIGTVELELNNDELIISGPQVSPGYLTEAGLIPFNRHYATKDLAKFENDTWWFQGRADQEMKWAGQKIDLTQIEKIYEQLTSQKGIAILNERFGVGLITNQTFDFKKVFHGLRESLPAVALPRNYFFVAAWPLNSAGKIDRQKLNVLANEEKLQKVNLNEDN